MKETKIELSPRLQRARYLIGALLRYNGPPMVRSQAMDYMMALGADSREEASCCITESICRHDWVMAPDPPPLRLSFLMSHYLERELDFKQKLIDNHELTC